ncbi:GldG family protein [Pseudomonadota bacterium]
MKVTAKSRRQIKLQNIVFVLLFLGAVGLLAWVSKQYSYQADWTANARNTLSSASIDLLKEIKGEVRVQVFSSDVGPLRKRIANLIERYQRYKSDFKLEFINPDVEPELVRELGITIDGELLLHYQGRQEKVSAWDEQSITNALQRLMRSDERWLVFVEGHGERSPFGEANHDLSSWAQELSVKGFSLQGINLATQGMIPDNTSVLVIAGPQVDFLPGEVAMIEAYLIRGGSLLWLTDPDGLYGLDVVAELLGVTPEPGVIVDPTAQMFAINDPTFTIVGDYGMHPVTRNFDVLTIFPRAVGLSFETALDQQSGWQGDAFLTTSERGWSETGVMAGEIEFNDMDDVPGPLTVGISLTRSVARGDGDDSGDVSREQRVVVVGDGDFISNTYLGNGGNLALGMNMVNWLSQDDQLISIPVKTAVDGSLTLSQAHSLIIGFGFLLVLPLSLLGGGVAVWLKRRKA